MTSHDDIHSGLRSLTTATRIALLVNHIVRQRLWNSYIPGLCPTSFLNGILTILAVAAADRSRDTNAFYEPGLPRQFRVSCGRTDVVARAVYACGRSCKGTGQSFRSWRNFRIFRNN